MTLTTLKSDKEHNLPVINVLTEDAKIVDDYPEYAGMDRYEARKKIVEDLERAASLLMLRTMSIT